MILFETFAKNGFEHLKPLKEFIADLKLEGWNKELRIGTSLYSLIFSRSLEHGLRNDQKFIKIDTIELNEYEVIFKVEKEETSKIKISDLKDSRLDKLLKKMKGTPIT